MEFKSIEEFTLKECHEYLKLNPNGMERFEVERRMNVLEKNIERKFVQSKIEEKKIEKQKSLEGRNVRWIDIKQFLEKYRYRKLLGVKVLLYFILFLWGAYAFWNVRTMPRTVYIETRCQFWSVWILIVFVILITFIIVSAFSSSSLSKIYNIEADEKVKSYRQTQNRKGEYGLHKLKKRKIVQILPFEYDDIYYYGDGAYVCVKGNKRGVYNTQLKKMVLTVEYDAIESISEQVINVMKNGEWFMFTTKGYRIIN